jgi:hypothetical protein
MPMMDSATITCFAVIPFDDSTENMMDRVSVYGNNLDTQADLFDVLSTAFFAEEFTIASW